MEEGPRHSASVPREDVAASMTAAYRGVVCRDSDGGDRPGFNSCD